MLFLPPLNLNLFRVKSLADVLTYAQNISHNPWANSSIITPIPLVLSYAFVIKHLKQFLRLKSMWLFVSFFFKSIVSSRSFLFFVRLKVNGSPMRKHALSNHKVVIIASIIANNRMHPLLYVDSFFLMNEKCFLSQKNSSNIHYWRSYPKLQWVQNHFWNTNIARHRNHKLANLRYLQMRAFVF